MGEVNFPGVLLNAARTRRDRTGEKEGRSTRPPRSAVARTWDQLVSEGVPRLRALRALCAPTGRAPSLASRAYALFLSGPLRIRVAPLLHRRF